MLIRRESPFPGFWLDNRPMPENGYSRHYTQPRTPPSENLETSFVSPTPQKFHLRLTRNRPSSIRQRDGASIENRPSFVPQRHHRIDARSTDCGDYRSGGRGQSYKYHCRNERFRILR